jgi:hypothetical protein
LSWSDATKDSNDQLMVAFLPAGTSGDNRPNLASVSPDANNIVLWSANKPANAVYDDGVWSVVLTRTIDGEAKQLPIGFGAWDGGNGEFGLKRSVSQWVPLVLAASSAHAGH